MKNNYKLALTAIIIVFTFGVKAQTSTFEEITLSPNTFNNGKDWKKGFQSQSVFYSNKYDTAGGYVSWSGFGVSNKKDSVSEGYFAEGNSITGGGHNNSNNYGVAYGKGYIKIKGMIPEVTSFGFYINNNSYAYYSMKKGDTFTRKYGDTTGTKSGLSQGSYPDYLLVRFNAFRSGAKIDSVVDFYLADYRFADNSKDYIVKDWQWVNLKPFGIFDSLTFSFMSSDTFGGYGINTPTYFCLDDFTALGSGVIETLLSNDVTVFPNPATNQLFIDLPKNIRTFECIVSDINGKEIMSESNSNNMDVSGLNSGLYFMTIKTDMGMVIKKFVKQ